MPKSKNIVLASKGSALRWTILALIVGLGFSAESLLKRDVGKQIRAVWLDACVESLDVAACKRRTDSHHKGCFDLAYTSMIFTFGRDRWDSFKLMDYEACMNRENDSTPADPPSESEIGI